MSMSISRFPSALSGALSALLLSGLLAAPVLAEEPTQNAAAATQNAAAKVDRDGKRICGYDLMTDSERGGHRSMLHATKLLEDRDAIRADLCQRMQKRANEKGVQLDQ